MSEDQISKEPMVAGAEDGPVITAGPTLPRAPRTGSSNRSYRPETAWVWQRARLVCAVKDPNA